MNREQAREYILARATDHLQRDKSGKGYICPICGSGSGKNGTGITTKDKTHYTCWAGCFQSADIFDIIGLERGLTDYNSQLQAACDIFGITLDAYQPRSTAQEDFTHTQPSIHNSAYTTTDTQQEAEPDYTDFFLQANKDLERTDYHRGLTLDTLNRFKVGFVESWKHPKAPNAPASPRLIIPTSRHSYLARDTRAELTEEQKKYSKSKVGAVRIFNSRAIERADKPIFIVEGEIDALSIIDVGGEAVGLGSLGNAGKLLKILENQKPKKPFIIALDNEEDPKIQAKVEAAVKTLEDGLDKLGIAHYRLNPSGDYKDANEALNGNREAFKAAVAEAENIEAQALEAERDKLQQKKDYERGLATPVKWHTAEEPPADLTKWDIIEQELLLDFYPADLDGSGDEYSESNFTRSMEDFVAEFRELVTAILKDIDKKHFKGEPGLSNVPVSEWLTTLYSWRELYRTDFYGERAEAESDIQIFNGNRRAILNGIAILRPSDLAGKSTRIDERGYYVEPEIKTALQPFTLEGFFMEAEDYADNIEIAETSRQSLIESYYHVQGYNASLDMIAAYYDVPELTVFKMNIAVLEDQIDAFNSLVPILYRKIKDTDYTDGELKAKKLQVLKDFFQPVDYKALTIPEENREAAELLLEEFKAFQPENSDRFNTLLCVLPETEDEDGEGAY